MAQRTLAQVKAYERGQFDGEDWLHDDGHEGWTLTDDEVDEIDAMLEMRRCISAELDRAIG